MTAAEDGLIDLTGFRIANIVVELHRYGYRVRSEPPEGEEEPYIDHLRTAMSRIEVRAGRIAKRLGCTPTDRAVIGELHKKCPEPSPDITPCMISLP